MGKAMDAQPPKHVVVATHGHCFDGLASAAVFTRLLRHIERGPLRFTYIACGYGPGQNGVDPAALSGDVNAILDFRFSQAPQLSWYFDHHVSAFPLPGDRPAYEARAAAAAGKGADRRFFHDGAYGSCTKLIADVGAREFGLDPAPAANLVRWADMIDTASFPTATYAVERTEPVMQLMTIVEHEGNDAFLARMVPRVLEESIEDVARSPEVAAAYTPIATQNEGFIALVRAAAKEKGGVVLVDLSQHLLDVATKFVTYALYPASAYSVLLTRSKTKCKISIGYNPWSSVPRRHDIASICERYGGGGHAVVGAISLPADGVSKAQEIAQTIAAELAG
jgi:hypothetical protein